MTALARSRGGALANAESANPFLTAGEGAGQGAFMKFTGASGVFSYGQDEDELAHGTLLAADVENAKYSWQFWWDGEVLEQFEVKVMEDPRSFEHEPDELPAEYDGDMTLEEIRAQRKDDPANFRDGWSVQGVVGLRTIEGEMEEYTFKLNAGVAMKAFQTLLLSYGRIYKMKPGLIPIIELGTRKYKVKAKGVGNRHAPILKIVDWKSEADLIGGMGEDPDDYDDADDVIDDEDDKRDAGQAALPPPDEKPAAAAAQAAGRRGARGRSNFGSGAAAA